MNKELIKTLSKQAWECVSVQDALDEQALAKFDLRFAELIIQECAEVAGCYGHVSGFALGDLIKQHFTELKNDCIFGVQQY
jgi:hypothetical protein